MEYGKIQIQRRFTCETQHDNSSHLIDTYAKLHRYQRIVSTIQHKQLPRSKKKRTTMIKTHKIVSTKIHNKTTFN